MPRQLIPIASAALKKYAIFYKTEVTDASDDFVVIGYICKELKKEDHFTVIQTGTHPLIQRYLLVGDKGSMNETWNHFVHSLNIISLLNWKQLDIYEGIPALYPATSGKFLPHDINLEKLGAIHFDKGCYTGQEIIARMHYRGKLKNHLYHTSIESTSTLLPGADFYLQSDQPENASAVIVDSCREESREKNYYNVLIVTDVASATLNHLNKV
jgi:folate-binding protein YgfZ